VHAVALVDDQKRVVALLIAVEVGFAVMVTVGAGVVIETIVTVITADATLLVPPAPVQVIE
jgi:hypothetical protein